MRYPAPLSTQEQVLLIICIGEALRTMETEDDGRLSLERVEEGRSNFSERKIL